MISAPLYVSAVLLHRCMSDVIPVATFSRSSFAWSTCSTPARVVRLSLISEQWAIHCCRAACPPEWRRHASSRQLHITQSLRLFLGRRSRRGEPAAIIQIANTRQQLGSVCFRMCDWFTSGSNRRCEARRSIPWGWRRARRIDGAGRTRIAAPAMQQVTQSLRLFLGRRSRRGEPAAIIQIVNTRHQVGGVCLCMCERFTSGQRRRCEARRSISWVWRRRRRINGESTRIDA